MAAVLEITLESGETRELRIGNTATIGRSPANDVPLPGSGLVSRQHAILRCHNGRDYQLMDLGSRNGTCVDGRRVIMPVNLLNEACISIGGHAIIFRSVPESAMIQAEEVTIASGTGFGTASNNLEVAILVCDLRGFSTFSESLSPELVARTLGGWFREVAALVHESGGVVDKFIGDAVLAYWSGEGDCARALDLAKRLRAVAAGMCWPESGTALAIGVALHHGEVASGNIGVLAQRDATIIGDAVNTAFRLEGLMKQLGPPVLLSEDFVKRLESPQGFEDLGEHSLKGKSRQVRVFGWAGK